MRDPDIEDSLATDELLATRLRTHLRRELDPHVGSALAKFHGESLAKLSPTQHASAPSRSFGALRYAAAAVLMLGLGVAGSIAYRHLNTVAPSLPVATITKPSVPFTDAVQSSWTQTYDQGTVMIDPQTPARMLRRVQYEKTDWKDESGQWQSRIDIPHEDVILVDMQKQ